VRWRCLHSARRRVWGRAGVAERRDCVCMCGSGPNRSTNQRFLPCEMRSPPAQSVGPYRSGVRACPRVLRDERDTGAKV